MDGQTRRDFLKVAALGATVMTTASVASPMASSAQERVRVPILLPPDDPKSVLMASVSSAELGRRWKAVREMMKNDRLDYLVIRNEDTGQSSGEGSHKSRQSVTRSSVVLEPL